MFQFARNWLRRRSAPQWFPLSQIPERFFAPHVPGAVVDPQIALTLSPVFAALRLYQVTIGSLPLLTYKKDANGGRDRVDNLPIYTLLRDRPNPAMSMGTLLEWAVKEMFFSTGVYLQVQKNSIGLLTGLFPIPSRAVVQVVVDAAWNKYYHIVFNGVDEWYDDTEIIHVHLFSLDGVTGCRLLDFAAASLGLHKSVQEGAASFYSQGTRTPTYLKFPGVLGPEALKNLKEEYHKHHGGAKNMGSLPVTTNGATFEAFPNINADDAKIIEALGASVPDVARWFNTTPLQLGDLSRGTYSNLGADNVAFYQRSIRPILRKLQSEFNWKIFGPASLFFCEFLIDDLLSGDPVQQAEVANSAILTGWMMRSEQRAMKNMPPIEGLDEPLIPSNMMLANKPPSDGVPPDPSKLAA